MIDMKCDIDRETIERYALGRLGELDSEFFAHIETCADCKEKDCRSPGLGRSAEKSTARMTGAILMKSALLISIC